MKVVARRPGAARTLDLRQPQSDEKRARIVAEAEPGGDDDDVLERAQELDAEVVARA